MTAQSVSEAPETISSSVGAELLSGLLGAGVAMACALPPVVHFVSGPLGPLIGGFVAANRVRTGGRGKAIIAVTIGTAFASLLGVAALVVTKVATRDELPTWFPTPGTLVGIVAAVWCYGTAMGAVGGAVSGSSARKKEREVDA
jgi:protein-S-isoprenylcysteine O-methyltransferase Ste14